MTTAAKVKTLSFRVTDEQLSNIDEFAMSQSKVGVLCSRSDAILELINRGLATARPRRVAVDRLRKRKA